MIRIHVELWLYGNPSSRRTLTEAFIWNDATGTRKKGNYGYQLSTCGKRRRTWRLGEVKNFPRLHKSVWWLILRVMMDAMLPGRSKKRKCHGISKNSR